MDRQWLIRMDDRFFGEWILRQAPGACGRVVDDADAQRIPGATFQATSGRWASGRALSTLGADPLTAKIEWCLNN